MRMLRPGETLEEYAAEFWNGGEPLEREPMSVCRECRTDEELWKSYEKPNTVDRYACIKCGKRFSVHYYVPWNDLEHSRHNAGVEPPKGGEKNL